MGFMGEGRAKAAQRDKSYIADVIKATIANTRVASSQSESFAAGNAPWAWRAASALLARFNMDAQLLSKPGADTQCLMKCLTYVLEGLQEERGSVVSAVARQSGVLLDRLHKLDGAGPQHALACGFVEALLKHALQLEKEPDLRPWLDMHQLYQEWLGMLRDEGGDHSDTNKQRLRDFKSYVTGGLLRAPIMMPDPELISGMAQQFPNFAEPLSFVAGQAALAQLKGGKLSGLPPMLMVGPPGTGKTLFCEMLAAALGSRFHCLSMSSQTSGFSLAGLDRGWSTGRAGMVFESIATGRSLAPVIMLDEIDKSGQDSRSQPLGPLYTLLEPHAAKTFRDEYAGVPMDASHVIWIATANDKDSIPAPLLSRFEVFEIGPPDADGLAKIAHALYHQVTESLPDVPAQMPPAWLDRSQGMGPRDMRLALQKAIGRAALRCAGSGKLQLEDDDFVGPMGKGVAPRIFGFLGV